MRLTLLGAPGAGKGTQTGYLAKFFNVAHISTGAILRDFVNSESTGENHFQSLGIQPSQISEIMTKGELIPDEYIIKILIYRLSLPDCQNGYILDGYPRNVAQAKAFEDAGFQLDFAVSISVSDSVLVERISGRMACSSCGKIYHSLYNPPKVSNQCDDCAKSLYQRNDDKTQTVIKRLKIYHENTEPILDFYRERKILIEVNGESAINEITSSIVNAVSTIGEN